MSSKSSTGSAASWPRVVDFSTHFSGPMASRALVHLGADVVKVENPRGGDGNRQVGNRFAGASDVHHVLNAGTRSIALDRRSEQWPTVVEALARWADVVIVGARPSDARRRGIDARTLWAANPELVHCSITGYGADGPWSQLPAHGLQPDVMAGLVEVEWRDGLPTVPAAYQAHGTQLAGLWAALGIQAGLLRRLRGEGGQLVQVSIWEAALSWMWREAQAGLNDLPSRPGFQAMGSRYRMYLTADQRVLLVCPTEQKYWRRFVDVLGLPREWAERGDWSRGADYGADYPDEPAAIAGRFATRDAATWERLLSAEDVPVAMVRTVREAIASEHAAHLGAWTTTSVDGVRAGVPLPPVSVLATNPSVSDDELSQQRRRRGDGLEPAPLLGAHTRDVLDQIGLGDLAAAATVS